MSWLRDVNARHKFRISLLLISKGAKTAKKGKFSRFVHWWPHVFVHCANTVWARRNSKTDLSSTMNYLSLAITLVTVVWVVLQITAWNHWSNSVKLCSALMATSWLLRIGMLLMTFYVAVDKFNFAPVQSPDMRSSRCKKNLVQGDEPQRLSVKFVFWVGKGNFRGQK